MIKPKNEGSSYLIDDALVKIEREQGMNRRTFVKGGVALAAMLAMGGAMGTYAWFTGSEVKENKTSIAENLEIEVVEPNFPSSGIVENVVPGAVIPKDPSVVNKSDVLNGYLFTEIRVPIAEVLVEGSEVAERLPLFSFEPNAGWKLLQEFEDGDEKVFRYGWTEVVEHGGQTGSVFDTVTFVNLTGSAQGLDVGEQLVKVIGYGIQDAEAFEGDVAKAWNAYKLQNGITDGVGNKVSAALIAGAAGNKLQFVSGTPAVGDVLDTGEVIEVVEDVEHLPAGDKSPLVSPENIGSVTVVEDVVATKPENTVNWFKDMDHVTTMDLSGLDTSTVADKTGMFDGTTLLENVIVSDGTIFIDSENGDRFTEITSGQFVDSTRTVVSFFAKDKVTPTSAYRGDCVCAINGIPLTVKGAGSQVAANYLNRIYDGMGASSATVTLYGMTMPGAWEQNCWGHVNVRGTKFGPDDVKFTRSEGTNRTVCIPLTATATIPNGHGTYLKDTLEVNCWFEFNSNEVVRYWCRVTVASSSTAVIDIDWRFELPADWF